MNFTEMGVGDMCVNLCCGDICVAQHGLYRAKIGAIHEQIGSKGVTEGMRCNVLSYAGEFCVFFDNSLNGARSESAEIARSIDGV